MLKFTFYLWLNDKNTKQPKFTTLEAWKLVMQLVSSYFGGWTVSEASGFYKHDDGTTVIENTLRIETLTNRDTKDFVKDLKRIFNQESVMVEQSSPVVSFE